ncbi:hypothetical protein P154DRAFT_615923 [Amniculicola lignicola CBS 123094]|uniref:Uncharacterized protein n=1 Tax=Amniculicola lignicola CBS 123094 TaxID=1392246 RepID=A0A6A5WYZ4_9PLEO|nr:hypothetical protein P154DRAFT_615923 [Amniculicola lignicola CBS 123094]
MQMQTDSAGEERWRGNWGVKLEGGRAGNKSLRGERGGSTTDGMGAAEVLLQVLPRWLEVSKFVLEGLEKRSVARAAGAAAHAIGGRCVTRRKAAARTTQSSTRESGGDTCDSCRPHCEGRRDEPVQKAMSGAQMVMPNRDAPLAPATLGRLASNTTAGSARCSPLNPRFGSRLDDTERLSPHQTPIDQDPPAALLYEASTLQRHARQCLEAASAAVRHEKSVLLPPTWGRAASDIARDMPYICLQYNSGASTSTSRETPE